MEKVKKQLKKCVLLCYRKSSKSAKFISVLTSLYLSKCMMCVSLIKRSVVISVLFYFQGNGILGKW